MKEKICAEIGIGNKTFLSTEFEKDKKVYTLSTYTGFKIKYKDKNKIKILFGIEGYNK